jgi:hypothetical protein
VCGLDSALCNKRRRAEFLELVARKVLLFNREEIKILRVPYDEKEVFTHRALGPGALKWILKRGIHLASFHLRPFYTTAEELNIHDALNSLVLNGHLDKLETVILNGCYHIKYADLAAILSKCFGSIKSVDIGGSNLDNSAALIKRCTKLEAYTHSGEEGAAELVELFQACPKLRKVDLSDFREALTDEALHGVAAHCRYLEHFSLQECSTVSDAAIRIVAESCLLLRGVNFGVTAITDATVVSLCRTCPKVKHIYLFSCRHLTDVAVLAVAERLPGLTHIDVYRLTAITSSAVETLANKCRELEVIDIGYCPNISDVTLTKISAHCSKLRDLRVTGCHLVTVRGLTEIATKCLRLTKVYTDFDGTTREPLRQAFPNVTWN